MSFLGGWNARSRCVVGILSASAALWLSGFEGPAIAEEPETLEWTPLEAVDELAVSDGILNPGHPLWGLPIVRVDVVLRSTSAALPPALRSVRFGEALSAEVARRAMSELSETGPFRGVVAEVVPAGTGVVLRLIATPSRQVRALQSFGSPIGESALLTALNFPIGNDVSEDELSEGERRLKAFLARRGYERAEVTIEAVPLDDPFQIFVVIHVTAGEVSKVHGRVFVIEPEADLHVGELKFSYEIGAGDPLDEEALERADRALTSVLREDGFLSAEVAHEIRLEDKSPMLFIHVKSGPKLVPLFWGNLTFDREQLLGAMELKKAQISEPREFAQRLETFYENHGFLDVRVSAEALPSKDKGLAHVQFEIFEGARSVVEKRVFSCLPKEIDPDEIGREFDAILEDRLPHRALIAVPPPTGTDALIGPQAAAGPRAAPLELSPQTTYAREPYDEGLKRIREILLSKGYLNAEVGPISVIRPRCLESSGPGECIEERVDVPRAVCPASDALPKAMEPLGSELECKVDPTRNVRCSPRIRLYIPIQTGPLTTVYGLRFTGNQRETSAILAQVAKLPLGEPLSVMALDEAQKRVHGHLADLGYANASVTHELEISPDHSRATVIFRIEERARVVIDDIRIEGATRTDEALILGRLAFQKGDFYSRSKLRQSEERIATLGTFSSVSVTLAEPEVSLSRKTVVVRVAEYPSQYIDPRIGFSSGEGLRFGFEYGHRNIGGLAIALTIRIQLSYLFDFMIIDSGAAQNLIPLSVSERLERRNSVRLNFPEVGLGPLVSFGIEGIDVRDNQRDFGLSREAIVPSLTFRPTRELLGTLSASVELNDEVIFNGNSVDEVVRNNPALRSLLRFPDGTTLAVAQRLGASWDRRDTSFAATRGTLLLADVEHVQAFPIASQTPLVSHFMKMSGRVAGYVRLTDSGVAIAVSVGAGGNGQLESESQTYPDRLFYMGGFDSLRSFLSDALVPEDVASAILESDLAEELTIDDVAIRGGDLYWNPRVELRVPLTSTFALGVFADAGNLWVDPMNFNPIALRYALGAGLRVTTPIGPLAFDYGINPDPRPWEDFGALHFSVGLF